MPEHTDKDKQQEAEQPDENLVIHGDDEGRRPAEDASDEDILRGTSYPASGRTSEEAAAQQSYHGGLVTGDPKPPGREDPTMPRELTNPAGAPLMPHPGVSSPMPDPEPVSTEEQMDEFAPQDREAVETDREAGEDDPKAAPKRSQSSARQSTSDAPSARRASADKDSGDKPSGSSSKK